VSGNVAGGSGLKGQQDPPADVGIGKLEPERGIVAVAGREQCADCWSVRWSGNELSTQSYGAKASILLTSCVATAQAAGKSALRRMLLDKASALLRVVRGCRWVVHGQYSWTPTFIRSGRAQGSALRGGIGFPTDVRNNHGRKILTTIDELDDAAVLDLSRRTDALGVLSVYVNADPVSREATAHLTGTGRCERPGAADPRRTEPAAPAGVPGG
jgi:hypothetical protein